MIKFKPVAAAIATALALGTSSAAFAIVDTEVQFSTSGSGTYDVTNINEFDWQSSGDLLITSTITVNGTATTLADYFGGGAALVGDIVVFDIYAQARLGAMLDPLGGSVTPATLDTNGTVDGDQGFEITSVLSAKETAVVINTTGATTILFTGITGTTTWYYDANPNSDVETGVGFDDGVAILMANLVSSSGTFTAGVGGFSLIGTQVTSYDTNYIQTDPVSNAPLVGATFDTLVSLISTNEASATDVGDTVAGYTVAEGDVGFKADANSEFFANPVPEPGTLFLLGAGLLGLGGLARRKAKVAA